METLGFVEWDGSHIQLLVPLILREETVPLFIIINPALNVFEISRALEHRII